MADPGHRQRRAAGARGAARFRQCRHRLAADHGPGRRLRHGNHVHRRCVAVEAADGPRARPAARDGRADAQGGKRRPHADHHARPEIDRADFLSRADGLGAGEIGGAAGRPEHAGRHHGHRAGDDARPHRKDAEGLRRQCRGRDRSRRRAAYQHRRPGQAHRPDHRGAGRPVVGRLPAGRGADRAGLGHHHRERADEPDPHRAVADAAGNGRTDRSPQSAQCRRRGCRRPARAGFGTRRA